MKKLFLFILALTGLGMHSQTETNPGFINKQTIIATPVLSDNDGTSAKITCHATGGYYVGGGYACCNIYCSNGVKYIVCVSKDDTFGGYARFQNDNNATSSVNVPLEITTSVTEDLSNNESAESKMINYKKITNAIINIDNELKFEYENCFLIITPGIYEVLNNKLQVICNLK